MTVTARAGSGGSLELHLHLSLPFGQQEAIHLLPPGVCISTQLGAGHLAREPGHSSRRSGLPTWQLSHAPVPTLYLLVAMSHALLRISTGILEGERMGNIFTSSDVKIVSQT